MYNHYNKAYQNGLGYYKQDKIDDKLIKDTIGEVARSLSEQEPIKIAVIGEAGVGKTSTINALFDTNLPVSHTKPCTQVAGFQSVRTKKGEPITIIDMPGLGDVESASDRRWQTYKETLPNVDSAVWVLSAGDRALESMQTSLRKIAKFSNDSIMERIIFGVNKSEHMYPEDWNTRANLPSRGQTANLQEFCRTVEKAVIEVFPRLKVTIKFYSAIKQFRLDELLEQMLLAAPQERRIKLYQSSNTKNYEECVDPRVLSVAKREMAAQPSFYDRGEIDETS